jgi:4a-hydroxytetrahydrobiopterin dehydratase
MNNWQETQSGLIKVFTFNNFVEAIAFVNEVAKLAEAENHHPEILVHSYCHVKISLFTHDENQITSKDYSLAKKIDAINDGEFE